MHPFLTTYVFSKVRQDPVDMDMPYIHSYIHQNSKILFAQPQRRATPLRSLPWAERRIYDAECTCSHTNAPSPVLRSFLFGLNAQHQLLDSLFCARVPASRHRSKVDTNAREIPDVPV